MRLAKLNEADLLYVADNMREWDRKEIYACRWSDDAAPLVESLLACGEFAWVVGTDEGKPVAALGAIPYWNGVWEVWMFATDDWPQVAGGVAKFIKRSVIPALKSTGAHRVQCKSMEGHLDAHRWLEMLGASKESEMKNYGRMGELFYLYCWTQPPSSTPS